MSGVLVDTSVWIDFFNGIKSKEEQVLARRIRDEETVFLCPTILQEILQGFRSDDDCISARDSLLCFPIASPDPVMISIKAAELYRNLRKMGLTIRKSNDCRIATVAIEVDLPILFRDRDFGMIAEHSKLKLFTV